jgi:hypothetical protein
VATVYKAYDTRLERDVAIKVIRSDLFGPTVLERMLKRFEREARALAKFSHPNIVKVLDYGEHDGAPYLVMEYLPGGTLKQKLSGRQLDWRNAVRLLIPIAQALVHAHESGIIHRDIKPANILITQTGEPMLSDFGIARMLESETTTELTNTGAGIGTPEYMAPEQGFGQADERANIYALGIVLYQMITGHVPFRADTPMAIMLKKSQEPLPRPKQFVRDLPDAVENVLIKLLARDPANRYQTARDVVNIFERLLRGGEVATETVTAQPAAKSKWIWIAAGAGALILLTCLIAGLVLASNWTGGGRASPQATTTSFVPDPQTGPAHGRYVFRLSSFSQLSPLETRQWLCLSTSPEKPTVAPSRRRTFTRRYDGLRTELEQSRSLWRYLGLETSHPFRRRHLWRMKHGRNRTQTISALCKDIRFPFVAA